MEYFAKIQEPKKLRISLMKAARDSIVLMSLIENIEDIRARRLVLADSLKEDFIEIEKLCKEMADMISDEKTRKNILSSAGAEDFEDKKMAVDTKQSSEEIEVHSKSQKTAKSKTEVDRLEYTLSQIEQKIANLSK